VCVCLCVCLCVCVCVCVCVLICPPCEALICVWTCLTQRPVSGLRARCVTHVRPLLSSLGRPPRVQLGHPQKEIPPDYKSGAFTLCKAHLMSTQYTWHGFH